MSVDSGAWRNVSGYCSGFELMGELTKYDAARQALQVASSVDERRTRSVKLGGVMTEQKCNVAPLATVAGIHT